METVLMVILAIIGILVIRRMLRTDARMHFANEQQAFREVRDNSEAAPPSWASNRDRVEIFSHGVVKLSEHRGVPVAYTSMVLSQREFGRFVLGIVGAMERQGSSFTEQQMTACEVVQTAWNKLPDENKAQVQALQDSGAELPRF